MVVTDNLSKKISVDICKILVKFSGMPWPVASQVFLYCGKIMLQTVIFITFQKYLRYNQ